MGDRTTGSYSSFEFPRGNLPDYCVVKQASECFRPDSKICLARGHVSDSFSAPLFFAAIAAVLRYWPELQPNSRTTVIRFAGRYRTALRTSRWAVRSAT